MPSTPTSPESVSPPRTWRWWIPATIAIAATSAIIWFYATEHTFRTHALQIFSTLGISLILLWFVFLSGQSRQKKWMLATFLFALVGAAGIAAALGWVRPKLADGSGWFTLEFGPARKPLPDLEINGKIPPAPGSDSPFTKVETRFLGPQGDGIIPGSPLVTDWEKSPPVELWRRRIGSGWASFAIASGKAVTLEQRDDEELTVCYDLETGDPLWVSKNPVRFEEGMGPGPRATPTIAADRVFSLGATGTLKCLDLHSGDAIWTREILKISDSDNLMYGFSTSPLISGDLVLVGGGNSGPNLIALSLSDGEVAWKAGSQKPSYASPVLATLAGVPQIVSVNAESVTGHDPESGTELWKFPWPGGFPKVGQPVVISETRILVTAAYGVGSFLIEATISPDGTWQAAPIWRTERLKTKFSSAVVYGGHAYGIDSGTFTCISLEDGARVWKDGRYGFGQNLLIGDTILVQAERGDIVLVAADPNSHRELARFPALDAKSWSAPALAGEFLLVRSEDEVACFRIARKANP